jgi:hypothetical protein
MIFVSPVLNGFFYAAPHNFARRAAKQSPTAKRRGAANDNTGIYAAQGTRSQDGNIDLDGVFDARCSVHGCTYDVAPLERSVMIY